MKCANCGKNTKTAKVVDDFDLSELTGVPAAVERMRVYRCSTCGSETVAGPDLERVLGALTVAVAAREGRLTGAEARFLRKRLGLTQDELGHRLGANKITISDWERGAETISKHYDYILRGLVLVHLKTEPRILGALGAVHENVPKKPAPLVLPGLPMNANER